MVAQSIAFDAIIREAVDLVCVVIVVLMHDQMSFESSFKENVPLKEVFDHRKCIGDGLSSDEVQERLDLFGYYKLEERKESKFLKFLGFMWNPLSWVMEAAAVIAIAFTQGGEMQQLAALMARLAPKAKVLLFKCKSGLQVFEYKELEESVLSFMELPGNGVTAEDLGNAKKKTNWFICWSISEKWRKQL